MGFVKTPEEIARIEHALANPRFVNGEMLAVEFLSDPDFVAQVLPPPLEPADTPRMTAMVSRWQSNCVGDFCGSAIYVAARHGDVEGDYVLAMWMDNDVPLIYGRDLFGEPKKLATNQLHRSRDGFNGWLDRGGVRLMELRVEGTTDRGPADGEAVNFNFKARPAANGDGLEDDAILTQANFHSTIRANHEGTGSIVLRGTPHDPLDEIPIVSVTAGRLMEMDLVGGSQAVATVPAADFLPYHHGRHDDWSLYDTESAALAASR